MAFFLSVLQNPDAP